MSKNRRKKSKRKMMIKPRIQTGFCILSAIFILGCCIYYGSRLVKYYKIYNPKSETGETLMTLASSISTNSQIVYEGDGLYLENGNYIYKGEKVNNYVLVNNMLFRILKVNSDKSIDVVLNDFINKIEWDTEYKVYDKSSIKEYINDKFLNVLDKNILEKTTVCNPKVDELSKANCSDYTNNDYVRLLGINDILTSMVDNKSYLVKSSEYVWLYNQTDSKIWHTSGYNISNSDASKRYGVKPVITLKNNVILVSGDGKENSPYRISQEGEEISVGTYLDINDDIYIVYEVGDDYYKVQSDRLLNSTRIFDESSNDYSKSSLKKYLEGEYLNSLKYGDLLKEVDFNGETSKIGILSNQDFKFNNNLKNYFLSDKLDNNVYLYNGSLVSSRVNVKHEVRPCLGISKDLNIMSGNGSSMAPFIVEV